MKIKILAAFLIVFFAVPALAFTNNVKWQILTDTNISGGVAVSGNTLLFGDIDGKFYALDKNSGSVIWSRPGRTSNYSTLGTPAVTSNGNVIFTKSDGTIACIKISDGTPVWSYSPKGEDAREVPSDGVAAGGGMIFVAKSDTKLYAYNENDGNLLWTYTAGEQGLRTAPVYSDGLVFLGEYDGIFSIIDAKTGKRLNGGGAGGSVNSPVVKDGVVYFSAWDGSVNAVKIKSVIPLWGTKIEDTIITSPALSGEVLAVGTGRGNVVAFDSKNGSLLWKYDTQGGEIVGNILNQDGVVIAGNEQGDSFVFNSKTGRLINKLNIDGAITANGIYSEGVFYFVSGNNLYAVQ